VIDTISGMYYESNVEPKELRLFFGLDASYKLMCKCFKKENGYNLNIVNSIIMKLSFAVIIEEYLKINFEIILKSKIMSNDERLSLNFNRIEQQQQQQQQQQLIQRLNQLEELVGCAEICMSNAREHGILTAKEFYKLNTTELLLPAYYGMASHWDYSKIKLFYKLEKLTITGCNDIVNFNIVQMSNKTVKELVIRCCTLLTSLYGLKDMFPNLKK